MASADDKKFLKFGKMVFGMMTDVLIQQEAAYSRRTITFPLNEDRTQKGSIVLMVFNDEGLADMFEGTARESLSVTDVPVTETKQ